jgi:hypothetical protein
MRIFRHLVNRAFTPYFGIDGVDGSAGSADGIEVSLQKAFAGDDVPNIQDLDPGVAGATAIAPTSGEPAAQTQMDQQQSDSSNWFWDELSERKAADPLIFDIPEEISTGKKADGTELSRKERFDMFMEKLKPQTTQSEDEDEFISSYKKAKQSPDFNESKFLQEQHQKKAIFSLDDDTFLQAYLSAQKTEDGKQKHSEQNIKDYVAKLNPIEKAEKAEALKNQLKQSQATFEQKQQDVANQKREQAFNEWESNRQKSIEDVVTKMSQVQNIGGIPVTESEIKEFVPVFDKLTQLNKETGRLYMDEYLQSNNDSVFKMLFLMHKAEKGEVNNYVSNVKQGLKEEVFQKLGIKPNVTGSSSTEAGSEIPSASAFK